MTPWGALWSALVLRDVPVAWRRIVLKQSLQSSASFLANTLAVARSSYVHPDVQVTFTGQSFKPAPLFTSPLRAGLTRGEIALL